MIPVEINFAGFKILTSMISNNSIVNNKFLKGNPESRYKDGERIEITHHQVSDSITFLLAVGHKFSFKVKEKVGYTEKKVKL